MAGGCDPLDFICKSEQFVESAVGDAIENLATAVVEAFGKAVASLGTIWVNIGTPNLTDDGGSSPVAAGAHDSQAAGITAVLGYVTWISLAVAVISVMALGGLIAVRMRRGEGVAAVGRLGLILGAVVLIAAASSIVSAVLPERAAHSGGTVAFLQSSLWWYVGAGAVLSVLVGAARMAWEQRAEPGRDLVRSLLTLIVVAGAGVTITGLLVSAADGFSIWIINSSLECDVRDGAACFGSNMIDLISLGGASGLGPLMVIILGLVAILASAVQILLVVARSGMLVILTGILPLSASATNTEMGRQWFKKCVAWLVAFILYKPAAAIVYAAAFRLASTDVFADDGSGLLAALTGLMLMVIALFAMPALMRFVTPMVGAMTAGGAGGAAAMGAAAALPTGAISAGRFAGGRSESSPAPTGGPSGASGAVGASGAGTPGASGAAASSAPAAGAAASGAGAGGAAAGGAAAGGATAAGAAGGPVGMAAGAALDVGLKAGRTVADGAKSLGERSVSEGEGPNGSR